PATAPATSIGWVSPASSRTTATRRRAVRLPGPDRARPTRIPERRNMEGSRPTFRSLRRLRRRTTDGHPRDIEGSCRSLPPFGGVQSTTVTSPRPPSSPPNHRHPHQRSPPQRRPLKLRGDRPDHAATAPPVIPTRGRRRSGDRKEKGPLRDRLRSSPMGEKIDVEPSGESNENLALDLGVVERLRSATTQICALSRILAGILSRVPA
ncbi:MAG: hypothetical protein RL354_1200, partial [Planctomycetota bacterium]